MKKTSRRAARKGEKELFNLISKVKNSVRLVKKTLSKFQFLFLKLIIL